MLQASLKTATSSSVSTINIKVNHWLDDGVCATKHVAKY